LNSNPITTNPEIQSWQDESTLSLITDEDFILADILERSANEEPDTSIYLFFIRNLYLVSSNYSEYR
jgi:hypothetical protein